MKASLRLVSTLAIFLIASSHALAEVSMRFQHLSRTDGLSQAYVYAITQDRRGYMWFGTQGGLNRFDGREFKVFRSNPLESGSLPHNTVRDLIVCDAGRLWVATDRGVAYLDEGSDTFVVVPLGESLDGLRQAMARTLYKDDQGGIWVGTQERGLYRIDSETLKARQMPAALSATPVWSIAGAAQGLLWIGTESGLFRYHHASNQLFRYNLDDSASVHVRSLLTDQDNRLWVGTGTGLYRQNGEQFELQTLPDSASTVVQVSEISQDQQGRVWIATFDGLYLGAGERIYAYRHAQADPHSLSHDTVLSVYEDSGQVLWVGTYDGVDRWNGMSGAMGHFNVSNTDGALRSNTIASFTEDRRQRVWVGTFGGGLHLFDPSSQRFIDFAADLPMAQRTFLETERIMALAADRNGQIWIGTRRSGLSRLRETSSGYELVTFRHDPDDPATLSSDAVSGILEDAMGELWIATFGGGMNRFNRETGGFERFQQDNGGGLASNNVLSLFTDESSNLWVGAQDGGLSFFNREQNRFQPFQVNAGNPVFTVASMAEDNQGDLWLGTLEFGLWRWQSPGTEQSKISYYNSDNGLPDNAVYAVQKVGDRVWVSTSNGIAGVSMQDGTIKSLDVSDGLQDHEFNHGASLYSTSGDLYFGGVNGFNRFKPGAININPNGPTSSITRVQIGSQELVLQGLETIEMSHKDYLLSFTFVGLDFVSPEQNHFRYRLTNLDEDWIYLGNRGEVRFTNLSPGSYELYVQSASNKQIWGPVLGPLNVVVRPAPWRTWWAYSIYLLLALLVVAAIVLAQSRRIRLANEVISTNAALRDEVHLREFKEQQLTLERDRVKGYLDASQLIHIELDKDGVIRFIDSHGLKVLDCEDGEAIGKRLIDLVVPDTAADILMMFNEPDQRDKEFIVENLQGGSCKVLWRSRMVVDSEAAEMRRLLVGMDVTELRQLEVAVRQREKMGAMGELAGGLAHDFNNILTAIYGYGVLGWQQSEAGTPLADYLQKIVQASERARSLVDRLLTFARSEESELNDIDVRVPIREAAELLRGSLPASITMDLHLPDQPLGASADSTRIHQLIMNLGTNGAKAMRSKNGTLRIEAQKVELLSTHIPPESLLEPGTHVRIDVADTGIGIAREHLEQIYNPFFTTSGEGFGGDMQGTGLGLAVVQSIVTSHHGHVSVDSYPGSGTTFAVLLPYRELQLVEEETYSRSFHLSDRHVVMVDDDRMVGEVGEVILQTLGFEVTLYDNPVDALAFFDQLPPDQTPLLITDEIMPGITGTELFTRVRETRPDIPVILTSGNLKAFTREDGVYFIRKPYTLDDFQETIEKALRFHEEHWGNSVS